MKILIGSFLCLLTITITAQNDSNIFLPKSLSEQWELGESKNKKRPFFNITPYKPFYILPANYTNIINTQPSSRNPQNVVATPLDFNPIEVKYQLSFKVKTANNLLGKKLGGSLWLAYTQSSRWQLYNGKLSRPFRESNYEPEALLIFPLKFRVWELQSVFAGIGVNHQSNGLDLPLSRNWNRIIVHSGFELNKLNIIARYWWRVYEKNDVDDNPGIDYFVGNTELTFSYAVGRHKISLTERHNLTFRESPKGSIRIDYSLSAYDNLKIHFQLFHGYGESLIDYNHRQTTFGIGVSI